MINLTHLTDVQASLLQAAIREAQGDAQVSGLMLQGSLARGDGYPGSDLDLFVLLRPGQKRPFSAEEHQGLLVEHHAYDGERAAAKIQANPMLVYGFLDGRILLDHDGELARLVDLARETLDAYRTPPEAKAGTLHWLRSARIKIAAAQAAGDPRKAAFVVATTSWTILEGMWAINDLPIPPSGTVLSRRFDLTKTPDDWETLFDALFLANTEERIAAALTILDWLLAPERAEA